MVDAKKKPDDEPSATQTLTAAQLRASGAEGGGSGSGEDVVVPVDQPPPVALGPEGAGSGSGEARPPPSATPTASDVTPSQDWEAAKRLALDVAPKFNHAVEKVAKTVAGVAILNPDLLPGGMLNDPAPPSAAAPKPAVVPANYEKKPASGGAETVSKPTFATIPAHSVPLVAPGIRQEIEAGEGAQFAGAQQQTEVEAQRADELARAKAQAEEDMRVLQLQHAQDRDRQRSALEDHLGQIQAKADAVAAKKVDPKQYMEQLGLGGQFLGALAVALGAFGQAFGGGPNVAFEMLNKQIDRNIESQAKNIELGHQALEADKGVYAEKMRLFGDDEKARAAAKQEALAAAAQQIDAITARYDSPDIRAKGEQIKGQLAREFGFEQAKLEQYKPTQTVQTGTGTAVLSNIKADDVISLPNGKQVAITDTAAREKAGGALNVARDIREAIPMVNKLLAEPAWVRVTPSWKSKYEAATKVFTSPEIQQGGGKGGIGVFQTFSKPLELSAHGLLGVKGALTAASTIADAKEREAEESLKRTNPVVVQEVPGYINPKTHEQERKFTILGAYKPGTAIPSAATAATPSSFKQ